MYKTLWLGFLLLSGLLSIPWPYAAELAPNMFVGDSITTATPTAIPEYKPSKELVYGDLREGCFGYFEALVEATATKEVPLRFRKGGIRRCVAWQDFAVLSRKDER